MKKPKRSAEYLKGYAAGLAKRNRTDNPGPKRGGPGRRSKYNFQLLKAGEEMAHPETDTRKIYAAARQWNYRNGLARRFAVRPAKFGSIITRLKIMPAHIYRT